MYRLALGRVTPLLKGVVWSMSAGALPQMSALSNLYRFSIATFIGFEFIYSFIISYLFYIIFATIMWLSMKVSGGNYAASALMALLVTDPTSPLAYTVTTLSYYFLPTTEVSSVSLWTWLGLVQTAAYINACLITFYMSVATILHLESLLEVWTALIDGGGTYLGSFMSLLIAWFHYHLVTSPFEFVQALIPFEGFEAVFAKVQDNAFFMTVGAITFIAHSVVDTVLSTVGIPTSFDQIVTGWRYFAYGELVNSIPPMPTIVEDLLPTEELFSSDSDSQASDDTVQPIIADVRGSDPVPGSSIVYAPVSHRIIDCLFNRLTLTVVIGLAVRWGISSTVQVVLAA